MDNPKCKHMDDVFLCIKEAGVKIGTAYVGEFFRLECTKCNFVLFDEVEDDITKAFNDS